MEGIRRPMQGVSNVVRFNWHFYVCSFLLIIILTAVAFRLNNTIRWYLFAFGMVITLQLIISLIVSYYVYDLSGFYTFKWLRFPEIKPGMSVLNIHAGFDETSPTLRKRFPGIHLKVLDFYDPVKHTEVSIKRARKMYPPASGTQSVTTSAISLPSKSADIIFVTFAAHEIRDKLERVLFFTELRRLLKKGGTVIVTEHLRDVANLFAFNIGFIHFYSRNNWWTIFDEAGFTTVFEQKTTPFESTFFLSVNVS